jgi:hypothetical protein
MHQFEANDFSRQSLLLKRLMVADMTLPTTLFDFVRGHSTDILSAYQPGLLKFSVLFAAFTGLALQLSHT